MAVDGFTLDRGFRDAERADAARIYWQAFGDKLGVVLGPEPRALVYLHRVMSPEHALVARDRRGRLIAIAGFRSPVGSLAGGSDDDLRAIYGRLGAAWRRAALWLLGHEVDNQRFLIDGIAVDQEARGCGAGTALLQALCVEARAQGYDTARLEVIDRNHRARALYEREGFIATRTSRTGPLRPVFGFAAAITMVRFLDGGVAGRPADPAAAAAAGRRVAALSRTPRRRDRTT